jgi:hypothetical protein
VHRQAAVAHVDRLGAQGIMDPQPTDSSCRGRRNDLSGDSCEQQYPAPTRTDHVALYERDGDDVHRIRVGEGYRGTSCKVKVAEVDGGGDRALQCRVAWSSNSRRGGRQGADYKSRDTVVEELLGRTALLVATTRIDQRMRYAEQGRGPVGSRGSCAGSSSSSNLSTSAWVATHWGKCP